MISVNIIKKLPAITIDASFELESGCAVLSGASGAGKTSIINMIAGLMKPDSGNITINSNPLYDSDKNINVLPEKRRAGYVFQESRLFPHMTVMKNLMYGKRKNEAGLIAPEELTKLLGIEHLLERYPKNLSGGEKQRVALGRALLSSPEILLMDEPMASLDASRTEELLDYISVVKSTFKIPVVYVTHTFDEILRIADYVGIVESGSIVRYGKAADVLNSREFTSKLPEKEFGVVCEGEVVDVDSAASISTVCFYGKKLAVAHAGLAKGDRVRFKIQAADVVLSANAVETSMRNVFEAKITGTIMREHVVDILTDIGGFSIWARISKHSYNQMELAKRDKVYTMVKSVVASQALYKINSP